MNIIEFLSVQRVRAHKRFVKGLSSQIIFELVTFGVKQAWACLFGGLMLALILGTYLLYPADAALSRFDFLTLSAIAIQAVLILTGLEEWEEAKVILFFHIVGTVMEVFKTSVGSWVYPGEAILRIGGVPLFSGFMYACVGSYIARVWRIFDFKYDRFPPLWMQGVLALAIYINFFTHHYTVDIRIVLFIAAALIYGPCTIWFRADIQHRPMPLLLGLFLVALFIWFAENLGTYAQAWAYPGQESGWRIVSLGKLGSWFLLMLISFTLVAALYAPNRRSADL